MRQSSLHAVLRALAAEQLRHWRKQFHFDVLLRCSVKLAHRPCVRIPDLLVCSLPIRPGKVLNTVPLGILEIRSRDDRTGRQMERLRDYWEYGVRQIVVLDPEEYTALRYEDGALIEGPVAELVLPDGSRVPFRSADLFNELREELSRTA